MNENISPIKFLPHTLSEIPKHIKKRIWRANQKRTHIQSILDTGNINEIRKIKLIFTEIKIDPDDIKAIAENQINEKYLRISLQDIQFSITAYKKHIKELDREFNADTGKVGIKRLIFTKQTYVHY